MIEVSVPDIIEKTVSQWHKKRGLVFAFLVLCGLTALIISYFDKNNQLAQCYFYSFVIIFIVLTLIWLFTTNRVIIRNGNDLVMAIMILVDEAEETQSLYKISKGAIARIKNSAELKDVKFISLPTNFLSSLKDVKKYFISNPNNLDLFLILHVNSGNVQNDHKTEIKHFEFVYNLNYMPHEKSVFFEKIEFISEITFQNFHKKWAILNSNSFEDRANIKANLEDLLYHAIAIQYILLGKHEKSLMILEKILNKEKLKLEIDPANNKVLKAKPEFISQSRILHLLSTLYLAISDKYMYANSRKALEFLKNLERLMPIHKYSLLQYIRMARMSYECNDLEKAIFYTDKAAKIDRKEPAIFLNRVFFGVLKKDWEMIFNNLREVFHQRKKINIIVDVIDFLSRESKKYPALSFEFNFVLNSYEALFLDRLEGKKKLETMLPNLNNPSIPSKIFTLAKRIIEEK